MLGFGQRWFSWISTLLATVTTSVFLNGSRGRWFRHHTGLRQGDPLSPMLFIIAMEPLQHLVQLASRDGALEQLPLRSARLRLSLYIDDAAIFLKPSKEEVAKVLDVLTTFGPVSGLVTNTTKITVYPISCNGIDLVEVLEDFRCPIKSLPCTYLVLPLHTRQIRRMDV